MVRPDLVPRTPDEYVEFDLMNLQPTLGIEGYCVGGGISRMHGVAVHNQGAQPPPLVRCLEIRIPRVDVSSAA